MWCQGKAIPQFGPALRDGTVIDVITAKELRDHPSHPLFYRSVQVWSRDSGLTFTAKPGFPEFQVSNISSEPHTMRETNPGLFLCGCMLFAVYFMQVCFFSHTRS